MQTWSFIPDLKMPRHLPRMIEIGLHNIAEYLTLTVTLLKDLDNAFGPPFIQPIANTLESFVAIVQVISLEMTGERLTRSCRILKRIKRNVLN
jgi:hypothetical protein